MTHGYVLDSGYTKKKIMLASLFIESRLTSAVINKLPRNLKVTHCLLSKFPSWAARSAPDLTFDSPFIVVLKYRIVEKSSSEDIMF